MGVSSNMTCIARKRLKDRRQVLITSHSTRFVKHLTKWR